MIAPGTKSAKLRGVTIAGNWKMNHGPKDAAAFFDQVLKAHAPKNPKLTLIVFPPAVTIPACVEKSRAIENSTGLKIQIGAQNAHAEKNGAFTGELSAPLLQEIGVHHALVGHSERRQFFGETDESAGMRTLGLLQQQMHVMLCVGETKSEREAGQTNSVLRRQLEKGMKKEIARFLDGTLSVAYEPVWAIGTGLTATTEQAEEAHQFIRKWIWTEFGMEASGRTPVLYGGSVKPENVAELLACPNIDGALVGGASLKPESFLTLAEAGLQLV